MLVKVNIKEKIYDFAEVNKIIEELWSSNEVIKLKEHLGEYLINNERWAGEDIDKDRCSFTWENLYKKYYESRPFWTSTRFDEYKCTYKRNGVTKAKYNVFYGESEVVISGDVLFNFASIRDDKKCGKYEAYRELLEGFDEKKGNYIDILDFCNEMTYTLHNFGFMPVTGSLQTFKANTGGNLDRLDSYIYWLDNYYEDGLNKNYIFKNVKLGRNNFSEEEKEKARASIRERLKQFLAEFNNKIERYCEEMYLITDSSYIKELIKFGKEEIKEKEDVVKYMEMAIKYWIMKDKIIDR